MTDNATLREARRLATYDEPVVIDQPTLRALLDRIERLEAVRIERDARFQDALEPEGRHVEGIGGQRWTLSD